MNYRTALLIAIIADIGIYEYGQIRRQRMMDAPMMISTPEPEMEADIDYEQMPYPIPPGFPYNKAITVPHMDPTTGERVPTE